MTHDGLIKLLTKELVQVDVPPFVPDTATPAEKAANAAAITEAKTDNAAFARNQRKLWCYLQRCVQRNETARSVLDKLPDHEQMQGLIAWERLEAYYNKKRGESIIATNLQLYSFQVPIDDPAPVVIH
ncbi:unnamed protein product, partial [Phaeothamnion confervicola]